MRPNRLLATRDAGHPAIDTTTHAAHGDGERGLVGRATLGTMQRTIDKLTGEVNRWHLTELLSDSLADAIRFRSSCAFLLIALDGLDRINDSYGFDVADEVIAAVAKRLTLVLHDGNYLTPAGSVLNGSGDPYKVYTPFARTVMERMPPPVPQPMSSPFQPAMAPPPAIPGPAVFDDSYTL